MSALFIMELQGEIQILEMVKSIHDWFIRLTANCQQTGIIRNPEPAELLGPAMTHMVGLPGEETIPCVPAAAV